MTRYKTKLGNCFVTGATGFLGSELVSQLQQNNECSRIVCLVRDWVPTSRYFSERLNEGVISVDGDIRDQNLLNRIINEYEIDTVFHLAAQALVGPANADPAETLDVNVRGTWALLEAARRHQNQVNAIIIASSDKAYGNLEGASYDESSPLRGQHPYDVSKSCADLIAQTYAHSYGMNVVITRCGNFFGPGDINMNRIFPSTILSLLKNERPEIRSNGQFIRDYIYVADGASAYRELAHHAIKNPCPGESFNFSYELRLSVLDVVQKISTQMKSTLEPLILDNSKNEIPIQTLNSSKAKKVLNWKPSFGFDEGVEKTIAWYQLKFNKGEIL